MYNIKHIQVSKKAGQTTKQRKNNIEQETKSPSGITTGIQTETELKAKRDRCQDGQSFLRQICVSKLFLIMKKGMQGSATTALNCSHRLHVYNIDRETDR